MTETLKPETAVENHSLVAAILAMFGIGGEAKPHNKSYEPKFDIGAHVEAIRSMQEKSGGEQTGSKQ